jgi:hypothetical protein
MPQTVSDKITRFQQQVADNNEDFPTALARLIDILDDIAVQTVEQIWVAPLAATTTTKATQQDLQTPGAMASIVQPDYARNIVATLTDANASITSMTTTIVGTDLNGDAATEVLTHAAAGAQTGSVAFATITSITTAIVTGTAGAGDTMDIGHGVKMGLLGQVQSTSMVKMLEDETDTGIGDVTVDTTYNTITFESAPNAALDFHAYYKINV